jgi:small-conductance mechanosensitive channel
MQAFRHIWHELEVHITYESDWKRAEEILLGILKRHATDPKDEALRHPDASDANYLRFFRDLEPNVWLSVTRESVRLSMRYLCDPRERRASERAIWHDVLDAFAAEPRIAFAYPTRRFYDDAAEGHVQSP